MKNTSKIHCVVGLSAILCVGIVSWPAASLAECSEYYSSCVNGGGIASCASVGSGSVSCWYVVNGNTYNCASGCDCTAASKAAVADCLGGGGGGDTCNFPCGSDCCDSADQCCNGECLGSGQTCCGDGACDQGDICMDENVIRKARRTARTAHSAPVPPAATVPASRRARSAAAPVHATRGRSASMKHASTTTRLNAATARFVRPAPPAPVENAAPKVSQILIRNPVSAADLADLDTVSVNARPDATVGAAPAEPYAAPAVGARLLRTDVRSVPATRRRCAQTIRACRRVRHAAAAGPTASTP